ncbi:hypothetical protein SAMN05660976_02073 [Nonomuraea pusilla]|uniref:Uncharacterized protein n=1 Tax=Nonomuraea pusilla TaxID=46177 RepID=A0A1H7NJQ0_9ACTN|nr:hypothetical protein SAMN05660976_02073 [Nonomuraea pusilla]
MRPDATAIMVDSLTSVRNPCHTWAETRPRDARGCITILPEGHPRRIRHARAKGCADTGTAARPQRERQAVMSLVRACRRGAPASRPPGFRPGPSRTPPQAARSPRTGPPTCETTAPGSWTWTSPRRRRSRTTTAAPTPARSAGGTTPPGASVAGVTTSARRQRSARQAFGNCRALMGVRSWARGDPHAVIGSHDRRVRRNVAIETSGRQAALGTWRQRPGGRHLAAGTRRSALSSRNPAVGAATAARLRGLRVLHPATPANRAGCPTMATDRAGGPRSRPPLATGPPGSWKRWAGGRGAYLG